MVRRRGSVEFHYSHVPFPNGRDPTLEAAEGVVKRKLRLNDHRAHEISGVSASTFKNWFSGKTRRPQNATLTQAMASFGYVRNDELRSDGVVEVGWREARVLDFDKEIVRQQRWYEQHHTSKNGHKKNAAKRRR